MPYYIDQWANVAVRNVTVQLQQPTAMDSIFARTFSQSLTFWVTCLRMRDKCKIISVQRNLKHVWYKWHWLFVNTSVVITVKNVA